MQILATVKIRNAKTSQTWKVIEFDGQSCIVLQQEITGDIVIPLDPVAIRNLPDSTSEARKVYTRVLSDLDSIKLPVHQG